MRQNQLSPAKGSRTNKKRLARGIGSGLGKTAGRGHKGLKSRSGGRVKPGFEGGQMPIHRRVPKFGFTSRKSRISEELPLSALNKAISKGITDQVVSLSVLQDLGLIKKKTRFVKIMLSGKLSGSVKIQEGPISLSAGAKEALGQAGGQILSAS